MRKLSAKQYAESLVELARGKSQKEIDALLRECINSLARQGKAKIIHSLLKELRSILDREEGTIRVHIVMASKCAKVEKEVAASLLNVFGKASDITFDYDPSLIGGMIVRAQDRVVDASVSNQIEKLRAALNVGM
ncbi:F0F1 ATP synthase subunit delta [Candidatus Uhrbacteria bacterium]|nr:F0F1 ATP synthase subunit delta [Candidatus Uhrbacteria bacterium]